MNTNTNKTENNFQYPKYTRKLFLADDDESTKIPVNQQQQLNYHHQEPAMRSYTNDNQLILGAAAVSPKVNDNQYQNMIYNTQSPYLSNTPSMPHISNYGNHLMPQQTYQQGYMQPQYQENYIQNQYIQYPQVSGMQMAPNYVQMMALLQQQQQQLVQQHPDKFPIKTSLKLKQQGVSLDDYNDSDQDLEEKILSKEENKSESVKQIKPVPYGKNKRSDSSNHNEGQGKNYKKPVISYEDNYVRPSYKTDKKVQKSAPIIKDVKANSFAAKYQNMLQKKEDNTFVAQNSSQNNKAIISIESDSDSDAPPEEVKIEKKQHNITTVDNESEVTKHETQNIMNESEDAFDKTNTGELVKTEEDSNDDDDLDEEESKISTKFIAGTGISLTSATEIKDWQQQRRINWLLKVSNKKQLHNEILANPESFMSSTDEEVQKFIQFQKDNNLTAETENKHRNTFKEFGKIKETVKKMFQQIEKDDHQNSSTANIASMKMIKLEEQKENVSVLPFIKLLGDLQKLDYKLTEMEKEKLFGYKK
ncbi:hypothetical protein QEN19_000453 [Hanseniaspora menglaensis]